MISISSLLKHRRPPDTAIRPTLRHAEAPLSKSLGRLERAIAAHVRHYFRRDLAPLHDDGVQHLVRLGILRASWHGFETPRQMCQYVDLMVPLGSEFDLDLQLPWAMAILADRALTRSPRERMQRLIDEALKYIRVVRGARGEHALRALLSVRKISFAQAIAAGDDVDAIASLLQRIYPKKFLQLANDTVSDDSDSDSMREWIDLAVRQAHGHELKGLASLYVGVAFLLGWDFPENPRYAWAAQALGPQSAGQPQPLMRAKMLYEFGMRYISQVLADA